LASLWTAELGAWQWAKAREKSREHCEKPILMYFSIKTTCFDAKILSCTDSH
jgi:hypothetical protein